MATHRTVPTIIETKCGVVIIPLPVGATKPTPSVTDLKTDPGPTDASKTPTTGVCPVSVFNTQPAPRAGCGTLTVLQTKALMAQIGHTESGSTYGKIGTQSQVGKYQLTPIALETLSYLKKGSTATENPVGAANWTGKNGVSNLDSFLASETLQETIMYENIVSNYNALVRLKGLYLDDSPCTVAGMLMVAHLLGPTGARNWRQTTTGEDANGTTGAVYFNRGRYAVSVLAPPTILA